MPSIQLEIYIKAPIQVCFDLSRSIDLHKNSMKHTDEKAVAGVVAGLIDANDYVCWEAKHFGVPLKLCSKITVCDKPLHFADEMKSGPFHSFRHDHYFSEINGGTLIKDVFIYKSPLGILGKWADQLFFRKVYDRLTGKTKQLYKNNC